MIDFAAIRKRLEATTEGPWWGHTEMCNCEGECSKKHPLLALYVVVEKEDQPLSKADCQFIINAREDITALLAVLPA